MNRKERLHCPCPTAVYAIIGDADHVLGFIRTEGTNDVFFHRTISPDFFVELGAKVEFDLAPGFKLGQPDQAINLRNAGGAA